MILFNDMMPFLPRVWVISIYPTQIQHEHIVFFKWALRNLVNSDQVGYDMKQN